MIQLCTGAKRKDLVTTTEHQISVFAKRSKPHRGQGWLLTTDLQKKKPSLQQLNTELGIRGLLSCSHCVIQVHDERSTWELYAALMSISPPPPAPRNAQ